MVNMAYSEKELQKNHDFMVRIIYKGTCMWKTLWLSVCIGMKTMISFAFL